ncbi:MAG: DUF1924 domain-containing protein [Nitrospiraceae bacterium]|nr:DUF1924 domain-containing protein [Nitrospiraceae bacterium]
MKSLLIILGAITIILGTVNAGSSASQFNPEVNTYMQTLEKQAKQEDSSFKGFSAERGRKLFFEEVSHKELGKISCATCHTNDLKKQGKNAKTGKIIEPLAPSVNKQSLTTVKNIEKWLKRNFKDVFNREGTAREKGDALLFINEN